MKKALATAAVVAIVAAVFWRMYWIEAPSSTPPRAASEPRPASPTPAERPSGPDSTQPERPADGRSSEVAGRPPAEAAAPRPSAPPVDTGTSAERENAPVAALPTPNVEATREPAPEPGAAITPAPASEPPPPRPLVIVPPPAPSAERPAASGPPAPSAAELAAVERVVTRYEQTYRQLDVGAVAAIWPTVDVRRLSRIFERIQRQDLRFDTCAFALVEERATATCAGSLTYVPRVGNGAARTDRHTWSIELERNGEEWHIVAVTAQ